MRLYQYIYIALLALAAVSCRDFHVHLGGDEVLVEVDDRALMLSELKGAIPKGYKGDDSSHFANLYIEKWINKQVKLREAERVFSESESDIEALVEEYRQSLLIRKLDEQYVGAVIDTTFTKSDIEDYYNLHASNFKLNTSIVKGRILRFPSDWRNHKELRSLMASDSESKQKDFTSICEKNKFLYLDLTSEWMDAPDFLDCLPVVRGGDYNELLLTSGIQEMRVDDYCYYFEVVDYLQDGDTAPIERVNNTIRKILITERQSNLIKAQENALYLKAEVNGDIRKLYKEKENNNKE